MTARAVGPHRFGTALILGAALLTGGVLGCSEAGDAEGDKGGGAAEEVAGPESLAPDFSLIDLTGRPVSLRSLRGKTVVIDFWATWCAPCVFQIPVLNEFYAANRAHGIVVLGIAVDAEGQGVVAPFAEEHEIRYPVLLGDESIARRFGAPGFPSLVVVGPDGRIAAFHVGLVEREALEEMVSRVPRRARAAAGAT